MISVWACMASLSFDLGGDVMHRLNARSGLRDVTILFDESAMQFDTSKYLAAAPLESYQSLFVEIRAEGRFVEWMTLRAMLNTQEVREQYRLDDVKTTGYVRTALIDFHAPDTQWWQVLVGRKLWRVANSLVYDDYGLGAGVSFDLDLLKGLPWRFDLTYIIPTREWVNLPVQSPFVTAKVDYVLSLFDSVSLSFSYFHDGNSELGEPVRETVLENVINSALPEATKQNNLAFFLFEPFNTHANLTYTTIALSKTLGPGRLKVTGVFQAGHFDVTTARPLTQAEQRLVDRCRRRVCQDIDSRNVYAETNTFGGAFDVSYRWSITERLALTPWLFGESGAPPQRLNTGNYAGYLGVLPFITRTNLFFAGGLNETFGSRRLVPAGVNGRGVIAGGVEATYEPVDQLLLRALMAPLFSWADGLAPPLGGGGKFYGFEVDGNVVWSPARFLSFAAEADVLFGGNFYREAAPAWKVIFSSTLTADGYWR